MARESSTADQPAPAPRNNKERIELLEAQMAQLTGLVDGMANLGERQDTMETDYMTLNDRVNVLEEDARGSLTLLQEQVTELTTKVNLLVRAIGSGDPTRGETTTRMRVPEPRAYGGARDGIRKFPV